MFHSRMKQNLHRGFESGKRDLGRRGEEEERTFVIPPFCVEGRSPTNGEGEEEL